MTNAKIVQLAKILTAAANSDMRKALKSLDRNRVRVHPDSRGSMCIIGTHKGNVNVEVDAAGLWYITCGGIQGKNADFIMGAKTAEARAFLIDLYVIEDESEEAA